MKPLLYRFYRLMERVGSGVRKRVTPAGWFLLGALMVGGLSGIDTNWSAHYQIFAISLACLLVSLGSLFFAPRFRVDIRRHCPRFATVGEPASYSVSLRNLESRALRDFRLLEFMPDAIPSWDEFVHRQEPGEEERNLFDRTFVYYRWLWLVSLKRLATVEETAPFALPAKGTKLVSFSLLPLRRGVLNLETMQVASQDCFGLFRRLRITRAAQDSILILPKRYRLPSLDLPGRGPLQKGGQMSMTGFGQSDEFVGLRDYRTGDPPRIVHWRSSARLQRLVVKEFEEESFPRYALALDTQLAQGARDRLFEEAVSVAASFVAKVDTREALLDLLFVDGRSYVATAGGPSASASTSQMLEVLAKVQPALSCDSLKLLSDSIMDRAGHLSACVLVLVDWCEERRKLIRSLRARGILTVPLVLCETAGEELGVNFLPLGEVEANLARLRISAHA